MPLVMPMYYLHDCKEAYEAKNQYYFGTEMIVAPVVNKRNREGLAPVSVWLPEGRWTDFFTGETLWAIIHMNSLFPLDRIRLCQGRRYHTTSCQ